MSLISKKVLIIENSKEIDKAIKKIKNINVEILREPILPFDWKERLINEKVIIEHPLFKRYNIEISDNNDILKAFYSLYLSKVDSILIGHIYTSKIVFIYSIIFFGVNNSLSSSFICKNSKKNTTVWTDCALNIKPNYSTFVNIIKNACFFYNQMISNKHTINVCLLSFSTYEDSNDDTIKIYNQLKNDIELFKIGKTNINLIGPIQYDAAINKNVYIKKTNDKNYKKPDIFVFPDLNSGNISYKIEAQYSKFYGPFVCGTNKKIADLSRSATFDEIYETIKYLCN